jgi:putative ABC transport system permease protein
VGTLALAIGATTAIFSVVNPVLVRPLDYEDPAELVAMRFQPADEPTREWFAGSDRQEHFSTHVTFPNYQTWQQETDDVFEGIAAYSHFEWQEMVNLGETHVRMHTARMTANLLPLLGVSPVIGRAFLSEDDAAGSTGVVILSFGVWQRYFGGSEDVLGKTIVFREQPLTVVGVMPRGFDFPSPTVQLWFPMAGASRSPSSTNYEVVGRLRADVTTEQAAARLQGRVATAPIYGIDRTFGATFETLHRHIVGNVRPLLLIFLAAVTAFLLIGCVNVVNLMLTRATRREKEHVVRAALGAGRGRLVQQLLTESTVLSMLGAALGFLLAKGLTDAFLTLNPVLIPRQESIGVDAGALGFTVILALVVGLGIGVMPAFRAARADLAQGLTEGARSPSGRRHARTRDGLIVAQLALALVLLVGSGLLFRSFVSLLRIETGFDPENVVAFETSLPNSRYPRFEEIQPFYDELLPRVRAWPEVQSAALVTYLPATIWFHSDGFEVEGYQPGPDDELTAEVKEVTPGYFRTLRIALLEGRVFDGRDDGSGVPVAVINESMARRYWQGRSAVGSRLRLGEGWVSVAGVVSDVRYRGAERDAPQVYRPYAGSNSRSNMAGVIRINRPGVELAERIRRLVASIDPEAAASAIGPLEAKLGNAVSEPKFRTMLLGAFGIAALLLSVVGVYGVMSYAVAQRTRELGIRRALGADQVRLVRQVIRHGLILTILGLGMGALGAYAVVDVLQSYLFHLNAHDPVSFVVSITGLAIASMLACYVPSRRAAMVDPLIALRAE